MRGWGWARWGGDGGWDGSVETDCWTCDAIWRELAREHVNVAAKRVCDGIGEGARVGDEAVVDETVFEAGQVIREEVAGGTGSLERVAAAGGVVEAG